MPDINNLASRIDAEFSAVEQKIKKLQAEKRQQHKQWQQRLEQLGKVFDQHAVNLRSKRGSRPSERVL